MNLTMDLISLMAKSATDAELNLVKLAIKRNNRDLAAESYKQQLNGQSMEWGLTYINDKIIVPE